MLKETFIQLLTNYTDNNGLTNELWTEIEKNYTSKKRHYHTLLHLDTILIQLTEVKKEIQNWETILFTLYYHDIIYNPLKSDNEEKSAELAEKRMKQVLVPIDIIELCKQQILATKSHIKSTDSDTNYFTDADLSVLGQSWEKYSDYYKNVRKEYSIYPDFVYNPGRKKVLNHFLTMDRIFKTDFFYDKFERQAKHNLQMEIELL
ncbi:HD domain-containing protein [Nubsella zeaxanthinifaciens]|uniref:HD domain-containing protein n=1 Tax=Nubsella zeaxanthinifaciens TaxID=392412 RepID=UPI003CFEC007